jgi:cytochrome P450
MPANLPQVNLPAQIAADAAPTSAASPLHVGRSPLGLVQTARTFKHNPLALFTLLAAEGDMVPFRFLGLPALFVNHPDPTLRMLTEGSLYVKPGLLLKIVSPLLGTSILNSDGPGWLQQRRMMQPAFHKQRIEALGTVMTGAISELLEHWHTLDSAEAVDMVEEMKQLTLTIVARSLFGAQLTKDAQDFSDAFSVANRWLLEYFALPFPPLWLRTRRNRQFHAALRRLDTVVSAIIQARRADKQTHDDLLTLLMEQVDEQGQQMSDGQLRNEIMALLVAGHETTANALCWAMALLAAYPEVERRLHDELETMLHGRIPTTRDLPFLPYLHLVVQEVLRLYPIACFQVRQAARADTLAGVPVPKGALLFCCAFTMHRHPAFWERPADFNPERFTPAHSIGRPRYAYFPFGGGNHLCIGAPFALREMQLVLAMIEQRYHLALSAGRLPAPEGLLSIQPQGGSLLMNVLTRVQERLAPIEQRKAHP